MPNETYTKAQIGALFQFYEISKSVGEHIPQLGKNSALEIFFAKPSNLSNFHKFKKVSTASKITVTTNFSIQTHYSIRSTSNHERLKKLKKEPHLSEKSSAIYRKHYRTDKQYMISPQKSFVFP
jgi:hypothetical protein